MCINVCVELGSSVCVHILEFWDEEIWISDKRKEKKRKERLLNRENNIHNVWPIDSMRSTAGVNS